MNRYGEWAMAHWKRWRPVTYSEIKNPEAFFTRMGEKVETAIAVRELELRAQVEQTADFLRQARLYSTCRLEAEQQVLREMVYLPPDPGVDPEEREGQDSPDLQALYGPSNRVALELGLDHDQLTPQEEAEAERRLRGD